MRAPDDMPRRRRSGRGSRFSGRGRIILLVAAAVLFVLFMSLRGLAGFYTDYLWFQSLDLSSVWRGVLWAQILLGAAFTLVFAGATWLSLTVADRLAPKTRVEGPEDELLTRYHEVVDRRSGIIRASVSLLFGLVAGVSMSAQWNQWILFRDGSDVGVRDAIFDTDVGFYLFKLPFISSVLSWAFASLVFILLITVVAHYLNGGIRLQAPGRRATPQVKAHISVLLALLAMVKAFDYWFERYGLTFSTRGAVDGAGYTDVNAQLPVLYLLLLISVLSCVLFIVNIWRRGWVLPVVAVGLWGIVVVLAGAAYPAFIQRVIVEPEESTREAPYIENNIAATRQALGLDDVEVQAFEYDGTREAAVKAVQDNPATIRNVRLLDPKIVGPAYQNLQAVRGYYRFVDLDVDRYQIRRDDGSIDMTQVVLANRDLDPGNVPGSSWEAQHLAYTHGYGMAMSPSNATDSSGRPDFIVSDVPVAIDEDRIDLEIEQPQIYFGEGMDGYAVVGTSRNEVDYLDDLGNSVPYTYDGQGGVDLDSWFRRAAFFLRMDFEWNLLFSGYIEDRSRIIYGRDVKQRVEDVAPFLSFDADPYPVTVGGRIMYVLDGYATSNHYPNAQRADMSGLPPESGLYQADVNYIANSVKAVIDAYEGTVKLYVVDEEEPIVKAYRQAFPDLFADDDELPAELREHYRFPEDLFRVQTNMWGRYHLSDPQAFFDEPNTWMIAQNPGSDVATAATQAMQVTATGQIQPAQAPRIDPYYVITRLPGETAEEMVMLRSFVPFSRDDSRRQLTAFMVAKSDPEQYGKLIVYEMPPDLPVDGPMVVNAAIAANEEISTRVSLLDTQGSRVRYGEMILVPINGTILYVRPLYVESQGASTVPELKNVIVVWGSQVAFEPTLREAMIELFGVEVETFEEQTGEVTQPGGGQTTDPEEPGGETPGTTTPPGGGGGAGGGGTPSSDDPLVLLDDAERLFGEADAALRAGDWATYGTKTAEAREKVVQAQEQLGASTTTTTMPAA
jgi:uncharacterized membrane protein (UPF0182 family)